MKAIMFNQDMVRALLTCKNCGKMSVPTPCEHCGSTEFVKSQTRRPLRQQPPENYNYIDDGTWSNLTIEQVNAQCGGCFLMPKAPFQVGEVRWVRERARLVCLNYGDTVDMGIFEYSADSQNSSFVRIPKRLKPIKIGQCCSNGCFRELARIFIKVTRVWAERVQDMTEGDVKAEGIPAPDMIRTHEEVSTLWLDWYELWNSCYPGSWDRNDWVWCCEFERVSV